MFLHLSVNKKKVPQVVINLYNRYGIVNSSGTGKPDGSRSGYSVNTQVQDDLS